MGNADFPSSSRYVGIMRRINVETAVVEAPLMFAPFSRLNGHHWTRTVPTARIGTPHNLRHDDDRA